MRALDLAKTSGVSYRQLDFWVRAGYIHCHHPNGSGSGYQRQFNDDEAAVVILMGHLTRAGLAPAYAEVLARDLHTTGAAHLDGGLVIHAEEAT